MGQAHSSQAEQAPAADEVVPNPRLTSAQAAIRAGVEVRRSGQRPEFGSAPAANCLVVDLPPTPVHPVADLVSFVLNLAGIGVVVLFAIIANNITHGVTQDVQNAVTLVLRQILLVPVNILEGLLTTIVPIAILMELALRGRRRQVLSALAALLVATLVAIGLDWATLSFAPLKLQANLATTNDGVTVAIINAALAAVTALLTTIGQRTRLATARFSWPLLLVVVVLSVVRGATTLPSALITVLLGRAVGHLVRYVAGVAPSRATDISLVKAVRRAGLDVCRLVRVDSDLATATAQWVTTSSVLGAIPEAKDFAAEPQEGQASGEASTKAEQVDGPAAATGVDAVAPAPLVDIAQVAAEVDTGSIPQLHVPVARVYAAWDNAGQRRDIVVLDGDRQVVGFLRQMWDRLRFQGVRVAPATTLLETANHAALLASAAQRAGVATPDVIGLAPVEGSIVLVAEHPPLLARLDALPPGVSPAAVADALWQALLRAHLAGLAHRAIDYDSVGVTADGEVWLTDWDAGETATNDLARRVDLAQLLTLLTAYFGEEEALASAGRALPTARLAELAPVLQRIALPRSTWSVVGKDTVKLLRESLLSLIPAGEGGVEPVKLARFSGKSIAMATLGVMAIWAVLGSLNFAEIVAVMRTANLLWLAAAFVLGALGFIGAGLALEAFAVRTLGLWNSIKVQVAASLVALVAPAGMGNAALNLRFVMRKGESTPQAITTVGLVQLAQIVVTLVFLSALALASGDLSNLSLPSPRMLIALAVLVLLVAGVMVIRPVREWLWRTAGPTLKQVWPRLVWVAGSPSRLARGFFGNFLLTASYVAALQACLVAFDYPLPITTVAIAYLASNALGSVIPSPGGVGPVEAALTAALTFAGIPGGVAVSAAFAFRIVTFWGRIPIGWLALRSVQKQGLI